MSHKGYKPDNSFDSTGSNHPNNPRNCQFKPSKSAGRDGSNLNKTGYNQTKSSSNDQDEYAKASSHSRTATSDPIDGVKHRLGARFFGEHYTNRHSFATEINHDQHEAAQKSEHSQNEADSGITKALNIKAASNNGIQARQNNGFITTHFNDSLAALLKTGIILEDNDILESNENSNFDLRSNNHIPKDESRTGTETPTVEEDLSQVSNQLKLIQQTQDTVLASLRNDIELVQTENLLLQQNNSRLQNQVSHLSQLVADLKFDLHQMHDTVKSNSFIEGSPSSLLKRGYVNGPPCTIHEDVQQGSCFVNLSEPQNLSNQKPKYSGQSICKTSLSRSKMCDPKARPINEIQNRYDKSNTSQYKQKSRRSSEQLHIRNSNLEDGMGENLKQDRQSSIAEKSRHNSSSDERRGCFDFLKFNKKKKLNQRERRRDRESIRASASSNSRARFINDEDNY